MNRAARPHEVDEVDELYAPFGVYLVYARRSGLRLGDRLPLGPDHVEATLFQPVQHATLLGQHLYYGWREDGPQLTALSSTPGNAHQFD